MVEVDFLFRKWKKNFRSILDPYTATYNTYYDIFKVIFRGPNPLHIRCKVISTELSYVSPYNQHFIYNSVIQYEAHWGYTYSMPNYST